MAMNPNGKRNRCPGEKLGTDGRVREGLNPRRIGGEKEKEKD
jgi:hypothetical protein